MASKKKDLECNHNVCGYCEFYEAIKSASSKCFVDSAKPIYDGEKVIWVRGADAKATDPKCRDFVLKTQA
jgi:hypothetical protein